MATISEKTLIALRLQVRAVKDENQRLNTKIDVLEAELRSVRRNSAALWSAQPQNGGK